MIYSIPHRYNSEPVWTGKIDCPENATDAERLKRAVTKAARQGASLSEANLRGANLSWAIGNMREVRSAQVGHWPVVWTAERIFIGCQSATISEWESVTDEALAKMNDNAPALWKEHGTFVLDMVRRFPATPTGHEIAA